jgi:hypothetical protein
MSHDLWLQLMMILRLASVSTFHQTMCPQSTRLTPTELIYPFPPNPSSQGPLRTINPSRILCSHHRKYPCCTPYTTTTSRSSWYLQDAGQGQGISLELLTPPPPTRDSLLPLCIKPYTSWGCLVAKPHPPSTSSNIHHTSHNNEYM